jgi:hypothetical protein
LSQNKKTAPTVCQLQGVIRSSLPAKEKGVPIVLRMKWALKRRLSVRVQKKIKDAISRIFGILDRNRGKANLQNTIPDSQPTRHLNAGDLVRVRSREEIQTTLDRWQALKGCGFLDEMADYCGTTQKVLKRVERFMDERDYRLKKASGIVLLKDVICSGTGTTGRCDRACFFFWREEWLEKLEDSGGPGG